jgi:hypothetical protein
MLAEALGAFPPLPPPVSYHTQRVVAPDAAEVARMLEEDTSVDLQAEMDRWQQNHNEWMHANAAPLDSM